MITEQIHVRPKTLQQRMALFVLTPLFFLLIIMGLLGFLYARDIILEQWGETAVANLQRASHKIDMRLSRPKEMLQLIHREYGSADSHLIHEFILEQLKTMDGIAAVNVKWPEQAADRRPGSRMGRSGAMRMQYSRMSRIQTSSPRFNPEFNSETVSIASDFVDKDGKKVGRIEVVIQFKDLLDEIVQEPWWKSNKAFIITNEGKILSDGSGPGIDADKDPEQFGTRDPLEKMTLEAIKKNPYGTVFGPGRPPEEISGYSHLKEAPWNIVIVAPGNQVMEPLIRFRTYYFFTGIGFVLLILFFLRGVLNPTTRAIKSVSDAARDISDGRFGKPLQITTRDEVGQLTRNFNVMSRQLEERLRLKKDMDLAGEMQQTLLPEACHLFEGMEICGQVIYCDETGGDYYDVIPLPGPEEKICVAVGDVVGHGIGAALLMTTTRALLRSCLAQGMPLAQSLTLVNRLLCRDTGQTGSFVTLFALVADPGAKKVTWARAGHDPAMLFEPGDDGTRELKGDGLVLGLDDAFVYSENVVTDIRAGSVILVGTDGAWEVENSQGQRLGRERVMDFFGKQTRAPAREMIRRLTSEIKAFKGEARQMDDITLVAVKFS